MPTRATHGRSAKLVIDVVAGILAAVVVGCSPSVRSEQAVPNMASGLGAPHAMRNTGQNRWIQHPLPAPSSGPETIAVGPDGNLWFSEGVGKIGRITPTGVISEFTISTPGSSPFGIVAGPDGNMWFTELGGNKIGRISMTGSITEYRVPTLHAQPLGITRGPDGALWFTEAAWKVNKIGRIATTGTITEYKSGHGHTIDITAGADGRLWFTGNYGGIGAITTAGVVKHYPTTYYTSYLTAASDGNIWFTELNHTIGRVTPAGVVTEYPIPGTNYLTRISQGLGGWLWISEPDGPNGPSDFARFDPFTQQYKDTLTLPSSFLDPEQSTVGPDGNMWFDDTYGNQIGVYLTH